MSVEFPIDILRDKKVSLHLISLSYKQEGTQSFIEASMLQALAPNNHL